MDESVFSSGKPKMAEVVELVREDLMGVQTGRAKPAMVEGVKVEAYEGSWMEIRELANISAPDSQSIVIKPWDVNLLKKIEIGINQSDLNLRPVVDNDLIRIKIPALTGERRSELVKLIKQKVEAGKAMLRQVRLEVKKEIDRQKEEAGVSEDDVHQMYAKLQEILKEFNGKLDEMEQAKEKELTAI